MKPNLVSSSNFQLLDEILMRSPVNLLSLNPQKKFITSFAELGNLITEETTEIQLINTIKNTLEGIINAQIQNFPGNIFWDFDFMVSSMLRQALTSDIGAIAFVESFGKKMVLLTNLFGINQEIHFRYVHDFMYGFDWARWVQKDPHNRAQIEPFSLFYLDYLLAKGKELLQRISLGQSASYKLCATGFRNPFNFSREPEDESRLLTHLAKTQFIPVPAWNWNASPVWNKPFEEIRQQVALKLNIQPQQH